MSSIDELGRWLWSKTANGQVAESSAVMQIRLDLTSDRHLTRLADRFGLPKATLAQEVLRAGIQDLARSNPYATAADVLSDEEIESQGLDPDSILRNPTTNQPYLKGEV